MDVYRAKIQSDGSLDKLKLRIVVRGDLQNKEMVGDTLSPTASMKTLKYFLEYATKQKAIFWIDKPFKWHKETLAKGNPEGD